MIKVIALLLTAVLFAKPLPASAIGLADVTERLAAIDSDLAECLTARIQAEIIQAPALRGCVDAVRPGDHTLRRDLNGWIPDLTASDPDLAEALEVRQALNMLRSFMNQIDLALLYRRAEIDPLDVEEMVQTACEKSRVDSITDQSGSQGKFRIASLCEQAER